MLIHSVAQTFHSHQIDRDGLKLKQDKNTAIKTKTFKTKANKRSPYMSSCI